MDSTESPPALRRGLPERDLEGATTARTSLASSDACGERSPDDGNLAAERLLVSQPVIDPICRVTLLLRDHQVVLDDLIDDALATV